MAQRQIKLNERTPDPEFRIVTELDGCGDVDNEIHIGMYNVLSRQTQVMKTVHPTDQLSIHAIRNEDYTPIAGAMDRLTHTIRAMRTNGEHVNLMLDYEIRFDVVLDLLEAARAAGVQCVVMGSKRSNGYCEIPNAARRPCPRSSMR